MKLVIPVVLGASLATSGLARAQPPEAPPSTYSNPEMPAERPVAVAAPTNALELLVGTGYTQGFGSLKSGTGMPSVATPGIGVDLGIGYRVNPEWGLLASFEYQELNSERTDAARGYTASVVAQYHFSPTSHLDPWLEFGAGYRFLWENPSVGPTLLNHGFQLARVRAGLDFRAGAAVSLGPMIGADATVFLFQDLPNVPTNISDPRLSSFVFAGLQGRFDFGNSTSSGVQMASTR